MRQGSPGDALLRAFAVAGVALAALASNLLPWSERLDNALLDLQWQLVRKFDARPAGTSIAIVGIDEKSAALVPAPGVWHEPLAAALARIASARPQAILLETPLPERAYDPLRPGLDRALLAGLAAARDNGPLIASLSIDARTRAPRPIHLPYLAILGEEGLGIALLARDADGVTRRFSLGIPTEDGSFPTLTGRLCRALRKPCNDGLIHFALGEPFGYVPLQRVLQSEPAVLSALFGDRIVLLGEVSAFGGRIPVPAPLAAWEGRVADAPAVLVHAQSLRTALERAAPVEAKRPAVVLIAALAALLVLVRPIGVLSLFALLSVIGLLAASAIALRGGYWVPLATPLVAIVLAWLGRAAWAFRQAFELRRRA